MLLFVHFSAERREFLKHLATLRGEAHTFLAMLNDTRRQVRELYYSGSNGDGAVGIQAYRCGKYNNGKLARILF